MAEWSIASDCKSDALVASVVRIHHPAPEADIAQLVEHVIGNDEVRGSIPRVGSRIKMKNFLTSYIISLPLVVLGVVCLVQASNPTFLVSADALTSDSFPTTQVLFAVGIIFLVLGSLMVVLRYVSRTKE